MPPDNNEVEVATKKFSPLGGHIALQVGLDGLYSCAELSRPRTEY